MRVRYSTRGRGFSTMQTVPIQSFNKRTLFLVAAGLAVLGIVLGTIGGLWFFNVYNFVQAAEHAEGTVIEIVKGRDREGHSTYWPVIAFTDHQGQRQEFEPSTRSSSPRHSVDDKLPILYDRDRPASASINSRVDLYLGPLIFSALAAGALLIAIVFFIAGLGKAKSRKDDEEEQNSEEEPASP